MAVRSRIWRARKPGKCTAVTATVFGAGSRSSGYRQCVSSRSKELSGPAIENSVAFYPFSGPDSMMITVFFPSSPTYVMVGLEPAGTLPAPLKIPKEKLDTYLAEVRDTVSSVVQRSFFITREMDREFRGQVTDGLFPPILLLLARSHHTVLGYRYVRLDQEGRIIERAADYKAPGRIGNKGLEIDFRTDADRSVHKLLLLFGQSVRRAAPGE